MNILCIGDVVGSVGCQFLRQRLPSLKKLKSVDLVIANGENSADGNGLTPASAGYLFHSGVDVITTGNHAFRRRESYALYEEHPYVLRPANFPEGTTPGRGSCLVDLGRLQVQVINLMGTVYLESLDCPFRTADRILANQTGQNHRRGFPCRGHRRKTSMGFYLDGRVSSLFGTHTHVQTADETILPRGTGYLTDAGMTGPIDSVLGVKKELTIEKMKNKLPVRFDLAGGPCKMDCVLFSVDPKTGLTQGVERLEII
ncbi:MAG: TIGR00282 family metallophosphoesterase [[Clostridium] leptum]